MFQRARERSEEGWPVIVFFDEMDSMFRCVVRATSGSAAQVHLNGGAGLVVVGDQAEQLGDEILA